MKENTLIYENAGTGEITTNHKKAVLEFYNQGYNVNLYQVKNNTMIYRLTWYH